jgi:lysozyme
MKTSDQGLKLLHGREGKRNAAYLDSVGVWTIGYGHTGPDVHPGLAWTDEQVEAAFAKDLERFEDAVNDAVLVDIPQHAFDALVSFAYNVGVTAFKTSTLVRVLNAGDAEGASAQFDRWHIPPEITSRRNAEREQFRGTRFVARLSDYADSPIA